MVPAHDPQQRSEISKGSTVSLVCGEHDHEKASAEEGPSLCAEEQRSERNERRRA